MSIGRRLFIRVQSGALGSACATNGHNSQSDGLGWSMILSVCPLGFHILPVDIWAESPFEYREHSTRHTCSVWMMGNRMPNLFSFPPHSCFHVFEHSVHTSVKWCFRRRMTSQTIKEKCVLADWQLSPLSVYFCRIHARVGQMTSPTHWRHFTSLYYEESVADLNQTRTFKPWIN